jgi:hypothetical protein
MTQAAKVQKQIEVRLKNRSVCKALNDFYKEQVHAFASDLRFCTLAH